MLATLALICASVAQVYPDDVGPLLQPATYMSPSGEWQLSVDPTQRSGAGPGRYQMTKGGVEVWSGEKSFTLFDADIDDRGYVGGYTNALAGERRGEVENIFVVFSPSGEYHTCGESVHSMSVGDMPTRGELLRGTFVHGELDRFVVCVCSDNGFVPDWRVFSLSSGALLERVDPRSKLASADNIYSLLAATAVRGTSLTLAQWRTHDDTPEFGSRFVLYDAQWKPVWSLALARDFVDGKGAFERAFRGESIVRVEAVRRFALRNYAEGVVVTYEVNEDKSEPLDWRVSEVARRPFESPKTLDVPRAQLHEIAAVPLKLPWNTAPIRDILALGFDAPGHVHFVRGEKEPRVCSLVRLDADYKVVGEHRIGPIEPDVSGELRWTLLSPGDWLVTFRPRDETKGRVWRADAESGRLDELKVLDGAAVDRAAATDDGGFVAKATIRTYSATRHIVARFDADGRKLWEFEGSALSNAERGLADTRAVAVAANGNVLLANGSFETHHMLQVISRDGDFIASVDLPRVWKLPNLEACELTRGPYGSAMVIDDNNRAMLHRSDAGGALLADINLQIEHTDVADKWLRSWHCDPTGQLWCTDGQRLICFDDKGAIKTMLGVVEDASRVRFVGWAGFDKQGHIGVGTSPKAGMHVFDADGHELSDADFSPGDFGYEQAITSFGPVHGWIHREGQPHVEKRAADGKVAFTIERRHDGSFFRIIPNIGVAEDGTLAVFEIDAPTNDVGNYWLHFHAPEGSWMKSVAIRATRHPDFGAPSVDFATHWILIHQWITEKAILMAWPDGQPMQIDAPIESRDSPWTSFALSPDESELWCVTLAPPVLHRYALPK
jgi:hypothetical protein